MLIMKKKGILILGKGPRQELDNTTMIAEAEYSIRLSLHYNGSNNYLFVNGVKIYHFKAKDSELNA